MERAQTNVRLSKQHIDLEKEISKALKKASQNVIAEEIARNGYLILSDKNGKVIKVPAKDL